MHVAWFERVDLECAQLHPPGSGRMMMVVHVVNADEHVPQSVSRPGAAVNEVVGAKPRTPCARRAHPTPAASPIVTLMRRPFGNWSIAAMA